MDLPIFKALTAYAMQRKFGTHIAWTHITRAYDVEMREIVYFQNSGMPYMMSRANRGGANPLEALCAVLPVVLPPTPLLSVLLLEAEVTLLGMAHDDWTVMEAKLNKACDDLWQLLCLASGNVMRQEIQQAAYACENCTGMIEHGCYCQTQGCPAPGVPPAEWDRSKEIIPKADVARVTAPLTGIPADPGEDDDL